MNPPSAHDGARHVIVRSQIEMKSCIAVEPVVCRAFMERLNTEPKQVRARVKKLRTRRALHERLLGLMDEEKRIARVLTMAEAMANADRCSVKYERLLVEHALQSLDSKV